MIHSKLLRNDSPKEFFRVPQLEDYEDEPEIPTIPLHLGHTREQFTWVDFDSVPRLSHTNIQNEPQCYHNLLGVIFYYENPSDPSCRNPGGALEYKQKFTCLQPGKSKPAKFNVIVKSYNLKDMPIPQGRGQIVYFRNCYRINKNTFIIGAKFTEWRVIKFVNELKAKENKYYTLPSGALYGDQGEAGSYIGIY